MRFYLLTLYVFSAAVFADPIHFADYNLPDFSKGWSLGNKIENDKETILIFVPKGTTGKNAKEFFGFSILKNVRDATDTTEFKKGLTQMMPKLTIDLWELEKEPNNILYEWTAKENGKEKVHGWGRSFETKEGNMVLGYFTENIHDVSRVRSVWLPVLQKAYAK